MKRSTIIPVSSTHEYDWGTPRGSTDDSERSGGQCTRKERLATYITEGLGEEMLTKKKTTHMMSTIIKSKK